MPLPPGVANKIRSHKFGRRKLATDSAWSAYNRIAANKDGKFTATLQRIASNELVQLNVTALNVALVNMTQAFGVGALDASPIKLTAPNEMFIPRSVWFGYVNLATGSLTPAQRASFVAAEKAYADAAGLLRAVIARILAVERALNDAANAEEAPNPGGQVGEP